MDISDNTAPVHGGKKIIVLCERVARDDIRIKFYDSDPLSHWEEWGDFQAADVHKQYAISIKTPRYHDQNIAERKRVFMELVKPSDDSRSDPLEFFFLPLEGKGQGKKYIPNMTLYFITTIFRPKKRRGQCWNFGI